MTLVRTGLATLLNQRAAVAAAIAFAEQAGAARTVQQGIPVGWRNVPSQPHRTEFDDGTRRRVVAGARRLRPRR